MKSEIGALQMGDEYSKLALVQKKYNNRAAEIIAGEIANQFKENPSTFTSDTPYNVADLGCADGVNSIPVLKAIVETIREINPKKTVAIYLNDIPQCDLNKAMANVNDAITKNYENIFVFAMGKSFYLPLFPANTMDLIYCITSVHMLSSPAPTVHDHWIFFLSNDMPPLNENTKKWAELGEKDWDNFLKFRENELKPNGRLYVGTHTINKEGTLQSKYCLQISKASKDILRKILEKYQWSTYEQDLTIAVISRKLENYKQPFETKRTNLQWISHEIKEYKDPIHAKLKTDPKGAKEQFLGLSKVYYSTKFQSVLQAKGLPVEKINGFLSDFFETYTNECLEIMKEFTEDYTGSSIAMLMKKPY